MNEKEFGKKLYNQIPTPNANYWDQIDARLAEVEIERESEAISTSQEISEDVASEKLNETNEETQSRDVFRDDRQVTVSASPKFLYAAISSLAIILLLCGFIARVGNQAYDVPTQAAAPDLSTIGSMQSINNMSFSETTPGRLTVFDPSVTDSEDSQEVDLPLKHTDVDASIKGYVASVEVQQEFINPYDTPIEAVYTFPLPERGTVYDMQMLIGGTVIEGEVLEREAAKATYDEAIESGKRASLLEQQRPNIFTQSVGNIMPDDEIKIIIRYDEVLDFDEDTYSFNFPTVVGPRYVPGDFFEKQTEQQLQDTISPPVLKEGTRSGNDISIDVAVDTGGIDITSLDVPTHEVNTDQAASDNATINLSKSDSIPNKDFILEYELASDRPQFAMFTHEDAKGQGYFNLMVQPQSDTSEDEIVPKEVYFMVDGSGSMHGESIEAAKEAMRYALNNLNKDDTFYIDVFASGISQFSSEAATNSPSNVAEALNFIDNVYAVGGTEMLPSILQALETPGDPDRLRMIVVMSDGMIGNEKSIIEAVSEKLADNTRLFSFGVGSSVNRYLMTEIAEKGRGDDYFISNYADPTEEVIEFYERIESPLLTNLGFDWGELAADSVFPVETPDLFAGQPLYISGTYTDLQESTITVSGSETTASDAWNNDVSRIVGLDVKGFRSVNKFEMLIPVSQEMIDNDATWVARRWAREKVDALVDEEIVYNADNTSEITALGLEHQIVTDHTSFVAVEDKVVNRTGEVERIEVPVELPDGTTYEGFYGLEGEKSQFDSFALQSESPQAASPDSYNKSSDSSLSGLSSISNPSAMRTDNSASSPIVGYMQLVVKVLYIIAFLFGLYLVINIAGNAHRLLNKQSLKFFSSKSILRGAPKWFARLAAVAAVSGYTIFSIFKIGSGPLELLADFVNGYGVIAAIILLMMIVVSEHMTGEEVLRRTLLVLLFVMTVNWLGMLYLVARYSDLSDGFVFIAGPLVIAGLIVAAVLQSYSLVIRRQHLQKHVHFIALLVAVGAWLTVHGLNGTTAIFNWVGLLLPIGFAFIMFRKETDEDLYEHP